MFNLGEAILALLEIVFGFFGITRSASYLNFRTVPYRVQRRRALGDH